ncbi:MAG: hypothetical protein ACLRMN_00055 [Mediterraneibacter gnavus]
MAQIEMLTDYLDQNYDSISWMDVIQKKRKCISILWKFSMMWTKQMQWVPSAGMITNKNSMAGENARSKMEEFLKNWKEYRNTFRTLLPYTVKDCVKALSLFGHPLMPTEMKVPIEEKRMRWAPSKCPTHEKTIYNS